MNLKKCVPVILGRSVVCDILDVDRKNENLESDSNYDVIKQLILAKRKCNCGKIKLLSEKENVI